MKNTSILFDMDGVLINSQPMHFEADVISVAHYGICMTREDFIPYAGTTNKARFTLFKELYHLDASVEEMVAYREKSIMDIIRANELEPIAGIRELLKSIRSLQMKTAVASSSSYDYIYTVLDKLKIREYFDKVVSGEDVPNGKPAPDIFLAAADSLSSVPEECVVIEDSAYGVLAGRRAGMKVVGFINPDTGTQDLTPATLIIDDFRLLNGQMLADLQEN